MNPIQDVLATFDRWDGALEREYIRSQQRAPEPADQPGAVRLDNMGEVSRDVACLLMCGDWWSLSQLAETTGHPPRKVNSSLTYLADLKCIERERARNRDMMRTIQRYRWVR